MRVRLWWKTGHGVITYQDVQAGSLEQSNLVSNAEPCKAGQPLGKLHNLNDALGGQLTELVPQSQIQLYPVVCTGVLQGGQVGMQAKTCPASYFLSASTSSSPLCIPMPSLSSASDHGLQHTPTHAPKQTVPCPLLTVVYFPSWQSEGKVS